MSLPPPFKKYSDQCKSSGIDFKNLPIDFSYKSNTNKDFLTVEDLKKLINKLEKDDT